MAADNVVLELLRAIRADIAGLAGKLDENTLRLASVEREVAGLHSDVVGLHGRLDRVSDRLARIERRLDLVDAP